MSGLYAPRETDFQWGPTTPTYLIHVPVKPVSPSSIIYSISVPDSGNPRNPAIFISCARPRMHVCFCERWWHSVLLPDLKIENTYSVVPSPARESRPFFRTMSENKLPRRAPLGSCCAWPTTGNGRVNTTAGSRDQPEVNDRFISLDCLLDSGETFDELPPGFSLMYSMRFVIRLHASRMYVHVHLNYRTTHHRPPHDFIEQSFVRPFWADVFINIIR